jgi:general transcription factor 3C polypeptide 3 (transcription factor C subunit 4)
LTKYRKLASKDPESQEEVEYNYGRSFHGIGASPFLAILTKGVPHLAVIHYEKVLEMVQNRMDAEEHEDVKEVSYDRDQC